MKKLFLILITFLILVSCGINGNISLEESLEHFDSYFSSAESVLLKNGFEIERMGDCRSEDSFGLNNPRERSCSYELTDSNSLDLTFYNENGIEHRAIDLWIDKNENDIDKWFGLFDDLVKSITGDSVEKDISKCFDKFSTGSDSSYTVYPKGMLGNKSLSICKMSTANSSFWEIKYSDNIA